MPPHVPHTVLPPYPGQENMHSNSTHAPHSSQVRKQAQQVPYISPHRRKAALGQEAGPAGAKMQLQNLVQARVRVRVRAVPSE